MDNLIKFPEKEIRILANAEKFVREIMLDVGATKDEEDTITPQLLEFIKKYNSMAGAEYQADLPASLDEDEIKACNEAARQVLQESFDNHKKIMTEVLFDLLRLLRELYIARGDWKWVSKSEKDLKDQVSGGCS